MSEYSGLSYKQESSVIIELRTTIAEQGRAINNLLRDLKLLSDKVNDLEKSRLIYLNSQKHNGVCNICGDISITSICNMCEILVNS